MEKCLKIWNEEWEAGESEWRETQIMGHQGLASYRCRGDRETRPGVNSALHDKAVGAEQARAVARLLAGGQGLRGGDPVQEAAATVENCCLWCLSLGKRLRETLRHSIIECSAYDDVRREVLGREGHELRMDVALMDKSRWGWAKMRQNREFLHGIILSRRRLGLEGRKGGREMNLREARTRWG